MKFLSLLSLGFMVSLAAPGSAPAASASAPATLGQSSLYYMYANNVSVAVSANPLAQSVAVWTEPSTMAIKYAIKKNGAWSGTKTVYTANANAAEQVTDPQVVIDAAGTATAVWGSTKQGAVTYCVSGTRVVRCIPLISYAKVATLPAGATSWTKANLSPQGWGVTDAQIGLDQAGNATALWKFTATSGAVPTLQSASRPVGGAWSAPIGVYAANASLPQLAVGANGAAIVAWTEQTAVSPAPAYAVKTAYRPAGGAWGAPETAIAQPAPVNYLSATVDGAGQAAVIVDNNPGVQWARRTAAGWGVAESLVAANAAGPSITSSGAGNYLITWLNMDPAGSTIEAEVIAASGTRSHAFWPVTTSVPPRAALSPDGSLATIAWADEADIYAISATPDPTTGWNQPTWGQTPLLLSSGTAQYSAVWGMGVALAAGPGQSATAVWLSVAGTNYQIKTLGSSYVP